MERESEQLHTASAAQEGYRLEDIMREFSADVPNKPATEEKPLVTGDTIRFEPVKAMPDDGDGTVKVVHSTKEVKVSPMHSSKVAPIKICEPAEEEPKSVGPDLKKLRQRLATGHIRRLLLGLDLLLSLFFMLYTAAEWDFLPLAVPHRVSAGLLIAAMVIGHQTLWQGIKDIVHLRGSLYTLGLLSAVICLSCGYLYNEECCAPLVVIQLFFLQCGLHNDTVAHYYTERTVQSIPSPMGVCNCPQLLENADSLRRDVGDLEDFRKNLKKTSLPQDVLCLYSMILLPLLPLVSWLLARFSGLPFLRVWLLLLLGSIPCSGVLAFSRPFAMLAKRLSTYGGALCAWHGARIFGGKHTVILRDGDLFPRSHIASNGMKLYGSYPAEQIISYALAALETADSPLADLFDKLLREQYGRRSHTSEYRWYDHGGIGAEIKGDIVLVGTLSFMRSMGVHMASGARVRQAVYVSVNGELAGVFAVKYKPSASTRAGLHDILANSNFSVVLATRDFLITPELIATKYALPTDTIFFPEYTERLRLSGTDAQEAMEQGALIARDTFGALAVTAAAGRTLKNTSVTGLGLALTAGILGLVLCILLIAWGAVAVASPLHIASFQLLWVIVSYFASVILLKL